MTIDNLRDFGRGQLELAPATWAELDRAAQAAFSAEAVVRKYFDVSETRDIGFTGVAGRSVAIERLVSEEFTFDLDTQTPRELVSKLEGLAGSLGGLENAKLLNLVATGADLDVPHPDLETFTKAVPRLRNGTGARFAALLSPQLNAKVAGRVQNGASLRREAEALLGGGLVRTNGITGGVIVAADARLGQLAVQWPGVHVCVTNRDGSSKVTFQVAVGVAAAAYAPDLATRLIPNPPEQAG